MPRLVVSTTDDKGDGDCFPGRELGATCLSEWQRCDTMAMGSVGRGVVIERVAMSVSSSSSELHTSGTVM